MYDGDCVYEEEYYRLFERLTSIYDYRVQYMLLVNRFNALAIKYNGLLDENVQLKMDKQSILDHRVQDTTTSDQSSMAPSTIERSTNTFVVEDASCIPMNAVGEESTRDTPVSLDASGCNMEIPCGVVPVCVDASGSSSTPIIPLGEDLMPVCADASACNIILCQEIPCEDVVPLFIKVCRNPIHPLCEEHIYLIPACVDTSSNPILSEPADSLPVEPLPTSPVVEASLEEETYMIYFSDDSALPIPPMTIPPPNIPPLPSRPFTNHQKMRKSHFAKMKFM